MTNQLISQNQLLLICCVSRIVTGTGRLREKMDMIATLLELPAYWENMGPITPGNEYGVSCQMNGMKIF